MDSTVKKVDSAESPVGDDGQTYLVSGKRIAMRLWKELQPGTAKEPRAREYETVGFVLAGHAELRIGEHGDQVVQLHPGDSWLVPAGAPHTYEIQETFSAVEATAPPSHLHGRED